MLYKVYLAQKNNLVKGDWVLQLNKDKKEFDLDLEDEAFKEKFKTKNSIKKFLSKKSKIKAQIFLHNKKIQHSKLDNIKFTELKCVDYLLDPRISKKEIQLLFKLRTRMYSVKNNFQNL